MILDAEKLAKSLTDDYEIFVIDDGSQDQTAAILQDTRTIVKKLSFRCHKINLGHGQTLKELYLASKKQLIFSLPGNGQIKAKELLKLVPYINDYDMVIGKRLIRKVSFRRRVQSKTYNLLINLLYGLGLSDVNSVRILKRSKLRQIQLTAKTSFVDAELCYKFKRRRFKIIEVPIGHTFGTSRGGGSLKTILPTFRESLTYWLTNKMGQD